MSTYEYWCCWCCCTYRVVPYDPSSVLATAAVVNRRSISLPRCIAGLLRRHGQHTYIYCIENISTSVHILLGIMVGLSPPLADRQYFGF